MLSHSIHHPVKKAPKRILETGKEFGMRIRAVIFDLTSFHTDILARPENVVKLKWLKRVSMVYFPSTLLQTYSFFHHLSHFCDIIYIHPETTDMAIKRNAASIHT